MAIAPSPPAAGTEPNGGSPGKGGMMDATVAATLALALLLAIRIIDRMTR
jgi:hypothetical protein